MRGFVLGLSVSLAFIVGVLSSSYLMPQAGAASGTGSSSGDADETPAPAPKPPPRRTPKEPAPELPDLVAPIPRWEYICYRAELTHKLVEVANQAGEEGWEMVGTDGQGTRPSIWCFKRRKNAPLEQ